MKPCHGVNVNLLTFVMIEDMIFIPVYLGPIITFLVLMFQWNYSLVLFLQNTNLYNLTASLCIALLLKMVSRDEILRDTRTWFGQPPVTNEQVPRGQTKQLAEICAVFVKSLLKHSN